MMILRDYFRAQREKRIEQASAQARAQGKAEGKAEGTAETYPRRSPQIRAV